ncbi:hypothetical protein [Myroides sp. WP-1]|uniref:hypothetical protein n=1 Tax=Myroides sp. WP-1 TaxID=2759944 RepID=UPI0015FAE1D6|nr:hypothetical protein [Myroides sp. WP-1]MBB1140665.1 hypothetical protein [Myroides sp. WP-1]
MQAVTTAVGIGVITKSGKLAEGVSDVGKQIGKNSREKLEEFITKGLQDKLEIINNHWQVKYPDVFTRGSFFEDLMGVYRYKKADGWAHTSEIADNFKGVDFYKDFTIVGNDIYAGTSISMKTTITKNVEDWLRANKNNIDIIANSIGAGSGKGITWNGKTLFYNKTELHIYVPKENLTPQFKKEWLEKLSNYNQNVKYEINVLEDYLK